MILSIAFQVLCLSASVLIALYVLHKVKAFFIDGTYALNREVEMGEQCSASFNTFIWDSEEKRFARYQKAIKAIEDRKAFAHERFERLLSAEKGQKEGA